MINFKSITDRADQIGVAISRPFNRFMNDTAKTVADIFKTAITALTNTYNNVRARFSKKTENTEVQSFEAPKSSVTIEKPVNKPIAAKCFDWAKNVYNRSLAAYTITVSNG